MTYSFTDLPARSEAFFATALMLRDCASDALDAVGFTDDVDGDLFPRRYVASAPPAWEGAQLCVYPVRAFLGQAGGEEFRYTDYGDGMLALRTGVFTVLLVAGGHPTKGASGPRSSLGADQVQDAAERLYRAAWAVFLGLIQAHDSDQLFPHRFMNLLAGPAEPAGPPQAGLVGFTIGVNVQI